LIPDLSAPGTDSDFYFVQSGRHYKILAGSRCGLCQHREAAGLPAIDWTSNPIRAGSEREAELMAQQRIDDALK
jgi:hypothetical protein